MVPGDIKDSTRFKSVQWVRRYFANTVTNGDKKKQVQY